MNKDYSGLLQQTQGIRGVGGACYFGKVIDNQTWFDATLV